MQRQPELDGVRGVAILLVLFAHLLHGAPPADVPIYEPIHWWLRRGGVTGVQLFFALSGFLITSILLNEVGRSGTIRLGAFWLRRLRRLYPPLLALIAAYLVVVALGKGGPTGRGLASAAMALTYSTDFLKFVLPGTHWLSHTWTLSVEEQFYLVWPLAVLAVVPRLGRRMLVPLISVAVLATIGARELFSDSVINTALRWDALLLGALVAVTAWKAPAWIGVLGASTLIAMSWWQIPDTNVEYTATAVAAALFVAGAPRLAFLRFPVLVHFGYISYSLYLWHVFILRFGPPGWVSLPLSIAVAELSYRFIERRFMANPPPRSASWSWRARDGIPSSDATVPAVAEPRPHHQ